MRAQARTRIILVLVLLRIGTTMMMVPNHTCSDVYQISLMKGIPKDDIPSDMIPGVDLDICPSNETCCSKVMETYFLEAVQRDFRTMVVEFGAKLKEFISQNSIRLRDYVLDMIEMSQNSSLRLFHEMYQPMEPQARAHLQELFADLTAFLIGKDVDLEERISAFHDALFVLTYQQSVAHDLDGDLSVAYIECLQQNRKDAQPFGEHQEKTTSQIVKALTVARNYIFGLNVAVEVLVTTEKYEFTAECKRALVRLHYCGQCRGGVSGSATLPCAGFCLNVVRGCFAGAADLDIAWMNFVAALEKLADHMTGRYGVEVVLGALDARISESLSYMFTHVDRIHTKVKDLCGTPRVTRSSHRTARAAVTPKKSHASQRRRPPPVAFYRVVQAVMARVNDDMNYFRLLGDKMCNDGQGGGTNCWNGTDVGTYEYPVEPFDVLEYAGNKELQHPVARSAAIDELTKKLIYVTEVTTP